MKYGRRAPTNAPALKLSTVLKSVQIPTHPAIADYGSVINDWQMLGNDQYGDCVAVTWANNRYLVTKYLADTPVYPDYDKVIEFYKTQNPNFPADDAGMVIQDALDYLRKNGGPDGVKAVAFAKVDTSNIEEVRAAAAIFGSIWYGINVTAANEQEFDRGQAWDVVSHSQILGGHGIAGVGYDPDVRFVTWGEETEFTDRFVTSNQMEEAWVVIYPEHFGTKAFMEGVDLNALKAAFKSITGEDLPTPDDPTPTPDPGAASFQVTDTVAQTHITNSAKRAKLTVEQWMNHHFDKYFDID